MEVCPAVGREDPGRNKGGKEQGTGNKEQGRKRTKNKGILLPHNIA
jgi:hypothetical protein